MANRERGEVDLTIDGKNYVLALTTNAQIEVEGLFSGRPFGIVMAEVQSGSMTAARAVLYAALRRHHNDLSLIDVGDLIDADRDAVGRAIGEAFVAAFPEAAKEGNPRKASR